MLRHLLLDNRYFILKTDHMNLTYINVTFTGNVLKWKMYLQDKDFALFHVAGKEEHQFVPDALSRLWRIFFTIFLDFSNRDWFFPLGF
jgi:hypothetical protein